MSAPHNLTRFLAPLAACAALMCVSTLSACSVINALGDDPNEVEAQNPIIPANNTMMGRNNPHPEPTARLGEACIAEVGCLEGLCDIMFGYCVGGTCFNGFQDSSADAGETGVDCGGVCRPCEMSDNSRLNNSNNGSNNSTNNSTGGNNTNNSTNNSNNSTNNSTGGNNTQMMTVEEACAEACRVQNECFRAMCTGLDFSDPECTSACLADSPTVEELQPTIEASCTILHGQLCADQVLRSCGCEPIDGSDLCLRDCSSGADCEPGETCLTQGASFMQCVLQTTFAPPDGTTYCPDRQCPANQGCFGFNR